MRRFQRSLASVFVACVACGGPLVTIEVDRAGETVVPARTVVGQLLGGLGFDDLEGFDLSASQELQNEGVSPGDIEGVILLRMTLSATDPANADLSFLERVEFFAESPQLPRVRVAHFAAFAPGESVAVFELDDVDLTDYATASTMTISAEVSGTRPDVETTVAARAVFEVGVTAQGACAAASAR